MLAIEPLASSSDGCAYLVTCPTASGPLLLDAGLRFEAIQRATGFKVTTLAGCLLSHAHGDHCKAVPRLLGYGVEVYASPEAWSVMGGPPNASKRDAFHNQQLSFGGWTVLPFNAVHDSPGTLGFLVKSPQNDVLLYLTDSNYSPFRFKGVTHMMVECNHSVEILRALSDRGDIDRERYHRTIRNHMSLERLVGMLQANDLSALKEIWLLHLSKQASDEQAFKREIQRVTGVPVFVASENAVRGAR